MKVGEPMTAAQVKALRALHRWLHQDQTHDCDLIEDCEDFHEEQYRDNCARLTKRWGNQS